MNDHTFLGKSITPLHASEKATGQAVYAGDLRLADMLTGKFCRSPYAHARILHIDTSRAEKLPGVKAVVTSKDAPGQRIGRWVWDRPVLAEDKVRHTGEAVAAVAAVDEDTAEEAASVIRVEYEELPVVANALEALKPLAPVIHEDLGSYQSSHPEHNGSGNVLHRVHIVAGDAEKALAAADVVHHESYSTPRVHQGFTQPHQVVASVDLSGKVTVWDSTKAPFVIRAALAQVLGLPLARVRVIATRVGGDFGGKGTVNIEPACVLLAMKSGCPVKMALDFREELIATFIRTSSYIDLTSGARRDGTLVAVKAKVIFDIGAYNDGFTGSADGYSLVQGPYAIPNVDIEASAVYSNSTPTGNCRAPRAPQQCFAAESHMDGLARKLGMDPLELRLKNVLKGGERLPTGGFVGRTGIQQTMQAARDFLAKKEEKRPGEGWGVASTWWSVHRVGGEGSPSTAWLKLNEDGTANLFTGCTEQGGGQHDILVQIVAETVGLPPEAVTVVASDTDTTPYEQGTGGSRTTYRVGTSVRLAAEDARQQLVAMAANKLKVNPDNLRLCDGKVFVEGTPGKEVTIAALCAEAITSPRGPVVGIGEELREARLGQSREDKDVLDGLQTGTHVVKVAVDRETGKVRVLKYFASHDVGFVLNPRNVEGQIDGGVVQGVGFGLTEGLVTENAETINASLRDYRMPRAGDAPAAIDKSIIETPSKYGPFGARGVGEPPTVPVAAAINNAVYDAVGVRLTSVPLDPAKIVAALKQKK
ncbi:MAG: xanthine dehydrogenase family protein molybdopterin-binding subunit [Chloroflexi bacterium]|nr:xanthine dehydrogenase family protein molybdopterin-binding subunit [Chloroflexota bacterium]